MLKKYLPLLILGTFLCGFGAQHAAGQLTQNDQREKIRFQVEGIASGKHNKAVVKMRDGSKRKGHIAKVGRETFELSDLGSRRITVIDYLDVAKVKRLGLSKAAKTALWIGVGAGAVVLLVTLPKPSIGPICPLGCGL